MKKLALLALLWPVLIHAQTLTFNPNSTVRTMKEAAAGLVIDSDYYDSIMLKNLAIQNPGFEPLQYLTIFQPSSGTTTSFVSADIYGSSTGHIDGAPYNDVRNGKSVCTGTIVTASVLKFTTTACASGFRVGDTIYVGPMVSSPTTQAQWAFGGWSPYTQSGGTVTGETTDVATGCNQPAGTADTQAVLIDTTARGAFAQLSTSTDTGHPSGQNEINVNGTLTATFCAKLVRGSGTLNVQQSRFAAGGFSCSTNVRLTANWAPYTVTCTAAETSASPVGTLRLLFQPNGAAQVELDNVSWTEPTTQSTPFRDATLAQLVAVGAPIRVLDGNQLPNTLAQLMQPDPTGLMPTSYSHGCNGNEFSCPAPLMITIPMAMRLQAYLSAHVGKSLSLWYDVGPNLNATDASNLAADLAPYLSQFKSPAKLRIEFCNECWNAGLAAGSKILPVPSLYPNHYKPYGYIAQNFFHAFKNSASYSASIEEMVLNAQLGGNFSLGPLLTPGTGVTPSADAIAQAPYFPLGATARGFAAPTAGTTSVQQLGNFAAAYWISSSTGYMHLLSQSGYAGKDLEVYEEGCALNGSSGGHPTQTELNGWCNGLGNALALGVQIQQNCAVLGGGMCSPQHVFEYKQYAQIFNNGSAQVSNYIWGSVMGAGAQRNNNFRPHFYMLGMLNGKIPSGASMIASSFSGSVPSFNWTAQNGIPSVKNVPLLYAYGYKSGKARSYFIYNWDSSPHTIALAGIDVTGTLTKTVLTSANLTDNNDAAGVPVVAPATSTLVAPSRYIAPAYSVTVLTGTAAR